MFCCFKSTLRHYQKQYYFCFVPISITFIFHYFSGLYNLFRCVPRHTHFNDRNRLVHVTVMKNKNKTVMTKQLNVIGSNFHISGDECKMLGL